MTLQAQGLGWSVRQFRAFDRPGLAMEFDVPATALGPSAVVRSTCTAGRLPGILLTGWNVSIGPPPTGPRRRHPGSGSLSGSSNSADQNAATRLTSSQSSVTAISRSPRSEGTA